jgi:putative nucleotidyltransferase with HDIG domain
MNRADALSILHEFVTKESLINHMLSVESAVRFYARKFKADEELWGICGLLHDFDYEIYPDLERHPSAGAIILRERKVPEEIIQAILSHGEVRDGATTKKFVVCIIADMCHACASSSSQ